MRKIFISMLALLLVVSIFAEIPQATNLKKVANAEVISRPVERTREVPEWNWVVTPTPIVTSFYDYSPGSYCSSPVRIQPEDHGNGVYIVFHAQETAAAQRRIYYVYVDQNGTLSSNLLTNSDIREGYAGVDVDKETGDPMYAWHAAITGAPKLDNGFCLDQFDILGTPGLLTTPYVVFGNPEEDEFIWPYTFIGPSPEAGMRRIYVFANNSTNNPLGNPSENVKYAYADFSAPTDISTYNEDDWTVATIPQLDEWHQNDIRPFKALAVSRDGKLAYVGHTANLDDAATGYDVENTLFVIENENYGDPDLWVMTRGDQTIQGIVNPENYFTNDDGNPYTDLRYQPYVSGHHNARYDSNGDICFQVMLSLSTEEDTWYPYMTVTKFVKYDHETGEFNYTEMYPVNNNPNSDWYLPWDPDGDGPQFEDGVILTQGSYPLHWYVDDDIFHEQNYKLGINGNWFVSAYQECIKAKYYNDGGDEDYIQWANAPEIYIQISNDYGETWMESISLNSIDIPEMADVIPAYVYVADRIQQIDETHGRVHMMFFDDNSYGSSIQGNGANDGGNVVYAAIDIDFGVANDGTEPNEYVYVDANDVVNPSTFELKNSPNPFNPQTAISFNIPQDGRVSLEIYNVKGEKVRTFVNNYENAGSHTINWNGTDDAGKDVTSGVYFYKLTHNGTTSSNKMLLLK